MNTQIAQARASRPDCTAFAPLREPIGLENLKNQQFAIR
jgi:hypothetical protein